MQLRRCASVSCARNNCCSSEEENWSRTINVLVVPRPQHRKLRPSNLAEDQQSGFEMEVPKFGLLFRHISAARTASVSFLCIWAAGHCKKMVEFTSLGSSSTNLLMSIPTFLQLCSHFHSYSQQADHCFGIHITYSCLQIRSLCGESSSCAHGVFVLK